jgi:hypothetical protein
VVFTFRPEIESPAAEQYRCFAFDAAELGDAPISGLIWSDPSGGVVLHHATLYATSEERPTEAPFDCDPMPEDAMALHVWSPGGTELTLPDGVGLELPANTRRLLIEAHVLRLTGAPAGQASVEVCRAPSFPDKIAARLGISVAVPAIRPQMVETSTARCRLPEDWHLIAAWPHMHLVGSEFHGALLRGQERLPIVDVVTWDFTHQRTYAVDLQAVAGDVIESTCVWTNPTSDYVLPGIYTENEMCTFGLIGWPAEAARCEP